MADEEDQREARDKHLETIDRLGTLRSDLYSEMTAIMNDNDQTVPSDLIYEREERGRIRNDLRRLVDRINRTIDGL